jgi:hypothetical protein
MSCHREKRRPPRLQNRIPMSARHRDRISEGGPPKRGQIGPEHAHKGIELQKQNASLPTLTDGSRFNVLCFEWALGHAHH